MRDLYKKLKKTWDIYPDIGLNTIMSQYSINEEGLPGLIEYLNEDGFNATDGLYLCDRAGLGVHLLGRFLIDKHDSGSELSNYNEILEIPYCMINMLYDESADGLIVDNLERIQGDRESLESPSAEKRRLLVITGADSHYQAREPGAACGQWQKLKKIMSEMGADNQSVEWVLVGDYLPNDLPDYFGSLSAVEITLRPIGLGIEYRLKDNDKIEKIYVPGELIGSMIEQHLGVVFENEAVDQHRFGVLKIPFSEKQRYFQEVGAVLKEKREEVVHFNPVFSAVELLRALSEDRGVGEDSAGITKLDTPSKWYCAAITASMSESENKYCLYKVSGRLIVRRLENNYVSDLTDGEEIAGDSESKNDEIKKIIKLALSSYPDMDGENCNNVVSLLKKAKKEYLSDQGREKLGKSVRGKFNNILKVLRGEGDDRGSLFLDYALKRANRDPSYDNLQRSSKYLSREAVLQILSGSESEHLTSDEIMLITATTLSESIRHSSSFFSIYAALSYSRFNVEFFRRYAWVEVSFEANDELLSFWKNTIGALGGAHPMAHSGSYYQSRDADRTEGRNYGCNWIGFKMQLLYLSWYQSILQDQGSKLDSVIDRCYIPFQEDRSEFTTIENNSSFLLQQDLNFYRFVNEAVFEVSREDLLFSRLENPYENAEHIFCDDRQICLDEDKHRGFGFCLIMANEDGDRHYEWLDRASTCVVAVKLETSGNLRGAKKIYDYLCYRHPYSMGYHFMRLQLILLNDYLYSKYKCDFSESINIIDELLSSDPSFYSDGENNELEYYKLANSVREMFSSNKQYGVCDLLGMCKKFELLLPAFSRHDEKYITTLSLLSGLYSEGFDDAFKEAASKKIFSGQVLENEERADLLYLHQEFCVYLVGYALRYQRNDEERISYILSKIGRVLNNERYFNLFLDSPDRRSLAPSAYNISDEKIDLVKEIVTFCFSAGWEMRKKLTLYADLNNVVRGCNGPRPIQGLSSTRQIDVVAITDDENQFLMIGMTNGYPVGLLFAWLRCIGASVAHAVESGERFVMLVDLSKTSIENVLSISMPRIECFSSIKKSSLKIRVKKLPALNKKFKELLGYFKNWRFVDYNVSRLNYYMFNGEHQLPNMFFFENPKNCANAVIEMADTVLRPPIFSWLAHCKFAYHWMNLDGRLRAICIPLVGSYSAKKNRKKNGTVNPSSLFSYNMRRISKLRNLGVFKMSPGIQIKSGHEFQHPSAFEEDASAGPSA